MRPVSHPQLNTGGSDCRRLLQRARWESLRESDTQLVLANVAANLQVSLVVFLDKCLCRMIYVGSKADSHSGICFWALSLAAVS